MKHKAAFAATGDFIDQHFGSARYYQIYEIEGSEYEHLETRNTTAKCQGNCEGGFSHLLEALNDCELVFVLKIGPQAAEYMIRNGKRVFEATGQVEEIIGEIIKDNLLEPPSSN
jgi:predicted Fe-Mo cluster-binding NifX family protein